MDSEQQQHGTALPARIAARLVIALVALWVLAVLYALAALAWVVRKVRGEVAR